MRHKNYILAFFFALAAFAAGAQTCPGPAQRQALINLQRANVVNGTRAYQMVMTDTCGNQRYILLDSLIVLVVDSIAADTALQRNWYTHDGTTINPLRTATIDSAAQWIGNNADGFLYWEMGTLGGGRLLVNTDTSRLFYTDVGGTNEIGAGPAGVKITTTSADRTTITTPQINFVPTGTSQRWNLQSTTGTNITPNGQSIRIFNTGTNPYLRREQTSGVTAFFDRYVINSDSLEIGYALGGFYLQSSGTHFGISSDEYLSVSTDSTIINQVETVASVNGINGQTATGTLKKLLGANEGDVIAWDTTGDYWEVRAGPTGDNWYNSDGTTTDITRIADVLGTATWRSDDVLLDGVYPFRFELDAESPNEPEMMVWKFPDDSLTLAQSDQEIFFRSTNRFLLWSDAALVGLGDSVQLGHAESVNSGDIIAFAGADGSPGNVRTIKSLEGTFNADMLSWAAGAAGDDWEAVPANRWSFSETAASLIPAESTANILIDGAGAGTVELNYTPAMPSASYTTIRYIYNGGAAATTVQTDQAWQFRDASGDLGASFSLGAGLSATLVWIYDATAANARFFVVRSGSGTGDGDILQNGNSFGAAMTIGTNDNNAVNVEVNGTTGFSMGTDYALTATASTASTNSADNRVIVQTNSTGTPAANFGSKILFQGESSTTDNQDVADIQATWFESTHATRKGDLRLRTSVNGTMTEMARFLGNNAASMYLGGGLTRYFDAGITAATTYTVGGSGSTVILGGSTGTATVGNSSGPVNLYRNPGSTSTPVDFGVIANSTGAVANGFGPRLFFQGESTTSTAQDMGSIAAIWTTATHASRSAAIVLSTVNSAGANTERMRIAADGKVGIGLTPTTDILETAGNISLTVAGNKLKIATGANASMGTATLVGGTVTVNTTAVSANSIIFLTCNTPGGTQGFLSAPAASITAATSFVINSSSGTDTSTVNWLIIN